MRRWAIAAGCLVGCAPVYVPAAMHVPMLEKRDDVHAAGSLGTQGFQGDAAWAVRDHWDLRARAQWAPAKNESNVQDNGSATRTSLAQASVGAGWFTAFPDSIIRLAASADVGGGHSTGHSDWVVISTNTGKITDFGSIDRSGYFLRAGMQGESGLQGDWFGAAVVLRGTWFHFEQDSLRLTGSARTPPSRFSNLYAEPGIVVRLGGHDLHVDLQGMISLAVFEGDINALARPFTMALSLGASWPPSIPREKKGMAWEEIPMPDWREMPPTH